MLTCRVCRWVEKFIASKGQTILASALSAINRHDSMKRITDPNANALEQEILKALKNLFNGVAGAYDAVHNNTSIRAIVESLTSPSLPARSLAAHLLIFLLSRDGPNLTLRGFDAVQASRKAIGRFDVWFQYLEEALDGRGKMGSVVGASDTVMSLRGANSRTTARSIANEPLDLDKKLGEYGVRSRFLSLSILLACLRFTTDDSTTTVPQHASDRWIRDSTGRPHDTSFAPSANGVGWTSSDSPETLRPGSRPTASQNLRFQGEFRFRRRRYRRCDEGRRVDELLGTGERTVSYCREHGGESGGFSGFDDETSSPDTEGAGNADAILSAHRQTRRVGRYGSERTGRRFHFIIGIKRRCVSVSFWRGGSTGGRARRSCACEGDGIATAAGARNDATGNQRKGSRIGRETQGAAHRSGKCVDDLEECDADATVAIGWLQDEGGGGRDSAARFVSAVGEGGCVRVCRRGEGGVGSEGIAGAVVEEGSSEFDGAEIGGREERSRTAFSCYGRRYAQSWEALRRGGGRHQSFHFLSRFGFCRSSILSRFCC